MLCRCHMCNNIEMTIVHDCYYWCLFPFTDFGCITLQNLITNTFQYCHRVAAATVNPLIIISFELFLYRANILQYCKRQWRRESERERARERKGDDGNVVLVVWSRTSLCFLRSHFFAMATCNKIVYIIFITRSQFDKRYKCASGYKTKVMCNICYFQSNYFSMFIYCAFIPLLIHCNISLYRRELAPIDVNESNVCVCMYVLVHFANERYKRSHILATKATQNRFN